MEGSARVVPIASQRNKNVDYSEKVVLGSILFEPNVLSVVSSILSVDDFANPINGTIYAAALELSEEGHQVSLVAITEKLAIEGKLDAVGGPGYLADLADNVGSASQAEISAKIIREHSFSRRYRAVCAANLEAAEKAVQGKKRLHEVLEENEIRVFELSKEYYRSVAKSQAAGEVAEETYAHLLEIASRKFNGISTGFRDLDRIIAGLKPGELAYLAARPGGGKTAFALNVANNCGVPVGFFSIEMARAELAKRELALFSGVDGFKIRSLALTESDWSRLREAAIKLKELKIYINDSLNSIHAIRNQARYLVRKLNVQLIVIDYLQLIQSERGRSREQEISEISRQLKLMTKELDVPVLCLAQLNRDVEKRESKRPRLSDLRESGSLEQDADIVLFLWPEEQDDKIINFSIEKNRNGRTGIGKLVIDKATLKFNDC